MQGYHGNELKNLKALVVEDCLVVRNIMLGMLDECGCDGIAVENGQQALDFYQEGSEEIDIVFLDLNLPDRFGVEVLTAMYQMNPEIKVVIMSGYIPNPAQMISTPGVTALLHKPFSYSEFSDLLEDTSVAMATA